MGGGRSSSSSSGEEDGDAEWKAAIDSVTATSILSNRSNLNALPSSSNGNQSKNNKPPTTKHYQIKALKLLDDILDQTIELEAADAPQPPKKEPTEYADTGVQLFRRAPHGIVFDHVDELHGPKRKPKIIPGEEIIENSKKFKKQLKSVVVDGVDIVFAANAARHKLLAKLEAREAAALAAARREEERVEKLKKIRGERWLPSLAGKMQGKGR
ncbi:uncharacterized protein LOC127258581 [Andrographis paniculata]|uniref:uncharacterized protein LOC127258581 n=1 Tax=Andrographis paniculata TaxID=175694 RepID=UPI0021E8BF98|nr:uncharacterized protein LOC127258581 [Andrographis paniculata]XP_051141437.1 uncharacterized protein LOC127258581 [Andrographis paniculata]XP_051141438.1 uncharacterized protein LOC127258581 [Andrographis paniculata]